MEELSREARALRHLMVGLLHALGAALGIALVLGVVLYATPLSEVRLPLLAAVGGALAVFWGALKASHMAGSAGLWHGLGVGMLFSLVVLLLSWTGAPPGLAAWGEKLGLSLLAGALGGIAGVAGR